MHNAKLALLMIIIVYVVVELISYAGLRTLYKSNQFHFTINIDRHFGELEAKQLEKFVQQVYDPLVGWDHKPNQAMTRTNCLKQKWTMTHDENAARTDTNSYTTTIAAAYGDSFTESAEVNDSESWPHYLSQFYSARVANYGVGGQGTYQALLKFQRHVKQGQVHPITILTIHEDNVARVVNSYRPFLYSSAEVLTFKPSVRCLNEKCVTYPNPSQNGLGSVAEAAQIAREAATVDYSAARKPKLQFSYLANTFKLAKQLYTYGSVVGEPMWSTAEGQAVMHFVLQNFYQTARENNSQPVVVFIPGPATLRTASSAPYLQFAEQLATKFKEMVVVNVLESEFDATLFNLKPYACHASTYGNQQIAKAIFTSLSAANRKPK